MSQAPDEKSGSSSGTAPGAALQSPEALANLQNRVSASFGAPGGAGGPKAGARAHAASGGSDGGALSDADHFWLDLSTLPPAQRARVSALRKLQFDELQVESDFYKAVYELESKFAPRYTALNEQRRALLLGEIEPTAEMGSWRAPGDPEPDESDDNKKKDEEKLANELKQKANVNDQKAAEKDAAAEKGVPHFWLRIFQNVPLLADMLQSHDEPILESLRDIRVHLNEGETAGFRLEFEFASNDFFTNTVLTKNYTMRIAMRDDDPFAYEGPEIISCTGCPIDWKKGKNVTVKLVKKVQKHKKAAGVRRTVTKEVKQDSFFNFFDPPAIPEDDQEMDDDLEQLISADFEVGHFIRERIVPRAVLYYTGEALDDADEDEMGDGEDEEGEEEDEEADEDDADAEDDDGGDDHHGASRHGGRKSRGKH